MRYQMDDKISVLCPMNFRDQSEKVLQTMKSDPKLVASIESFAKELYKYKINKRLPVDFNKPLSAVDIAMLYIDYIGER